MYDRVFGFVLILAHQVNEICSTSDATIVSANQTLTQYNENSKSVENLLKLAIKRNSTEDEGDTILPTEALDGVFTDCVLSLSYSCLQKKVIAFLYKLDKMKHIDVIGKTVKFVRKRDASMDPTIMTKVADDQVDQTYLKDIIDDLIDTFLDNHSLRIRIPRYFEDPGHSEKEGTYLDINFDAKSLARESRKKKYGKIKGLKNILMIMGLMTCLKLAMMGPLMIGLLHLKAKKALLLAVISLAISKLMMLSKVNFHNLLSGYYSWYSSASHGGWDRSNIEENLTLSNNLEPPAMYSSYTAYRIRPV